MTKLIISKFSTTTFTTMLDVRVNQGHLGKIHLRLLNCTKAQKKYMKKLITLVIAIKKRSIKQVFFHLV